MYTAAPGSSRQDTDHPRQGIGIDPGIHAHPDARRQFDANHAAAARCNRRGGKTGCPLICTSANAGSTNLRTPASSPDIAWRRQV